jgi:5-methylcytosine-specific restriction endonuclease McrA
MENKDFKEWQNKFYTSKEWFEVRNFIRQRDKMKCCRCGKIIKGKSIVDHIKEITPQNLNDKDITLNPNNLQLLCLDCHNKKTRDDKTIQTKYNLENLNLKERIFKNLF